MFWRIIRRLLSANRGRLFVMLLALGAGAAVTAALLNLQVDAKRRLTTEFRAFGANVVVAPHDFGSLRSSSFLDEAIVNRLNSVKSAAPLAYAAFLYGVVDVASEAHQDQGGSPKAANVILAGFRHSEERAGNVVPQSLIAAEERVKLLNSRQCQVGQKAASILQIHDGDRIRLTSGTGSDACGTTILPATGGPEDDQVFLEMPATQALLHQPGHISLVQLSVPGTSQQIDHYIADLQMCISDVEVRPIRQFTEGESRIYNRISVLLAATVAIVLLLTGLSVMAAMTNVAMERRMDVGLMKAIGGSMRRVLRLFLAEAALLGLAGGIIGAGAGIFLSIGLGKAVFGVAARPRLIVYPVAVALTVIVAILSAFPLRRLASIRPASVFRGEA